MKTVHCVVVCDQCFTNHIHCDLAITPFLGSRGNRYSNRSLLMRVSCTGSISRFQWEPGFNRVMSKFVFRNDRVIMGLQCTFKLDYK